MRDGDRGKKVMPVCVASCLHKNSVLDKDDTMGTEVCGGGGSLFAVD